MSASDKKQQRKAAKAEELTQKQRREQAEAKAASQKKIVYSVIGVICAVAAVALLVWNSMGNFHRYAVAATVDGVDYRVPDLQYYYTQARNQTYYLAQQYASMGYNIGFDASVSDGAQWVDSSETETYADSFRATALDTLKQTAGLCAAAKAEGYTLSAEGEQQVQDQLAQVDVICAQYGITRSSYFAQTFGNGVTEKVFVRNFRNDLLADEYSHYHQESISYEEADLKAYYEEHPDDLDSYDYRYFFISGSAPVPTDENGDVMTDENGDPLSPSEDETAEAMAAAEAAANAAVAKIQSAADKEQAFIDAAPNYVAENVREAYASNDDYSLVSVFGGDLNSTMASWLKDSARKQYDVTSIETSSGYYVVLFLDRHLDEEPTVNIRHILIRPEVEEDAETNSVGTQIPSQAAMDAAQAEAQALMDEWKSGEATAESFGALAEEHSSDSGSNTNGGKYTYVYQGQMVPNFDAWCFDPARQPGDVGLVENSGDEAYYYGWHVIYFESLEEPYWKGEVIEAKQQSDQSDWLSSIYDSVEAVEASGLKYVGPANTAVPSESSAPVGDNEPVVDDAEESAAAE